MEHGGRGNVLTDGATGIKKCSVLWHVTLSDLLIFIEVLEKGLCCVLAAVKIEIEVLTQRR